MTSCVQSLTSYPNSIPPPTPGNYISFNSESVSVTQINSAPNWARWPNNVIHYLALRAVKQENVTCAASAEPASVNNCLGRMTNPNIILTGIVNLTISNSGSNYIANHYSNPRNVTHTSFNNSNIIPQSLNSI